MKKITYMTMAMVFSLGLGLAYAGGNGVTDFTGRTYNTLEIAPAASIEHNAFEGTAAGGTRLVESDNGKLHNGVTDFSGRTYDVLEISAAPAASNVVEGSAAGGMRQNFATEKSSVRTYDSLELVW
jgi:hypothetical protein